MTWTDNICPITDDICEQALPATGDYIEVVCPTCGRFRISGTLMQNIHERSIEDRIDLLNAAKARAPLGRVPTITSYTDED